MKDVPGLIQQVLAAQANVEELPFTLLSQRAKRRKIIIKKRHI
jgi:hypothetical protein